MSRPTPVLALLGAALLLSACSAATPAASGAATPGATPTDAPPPSLELREVAVTPAQRAEAGIAAAFDAAEAADLVDSVPADLDLVRDALICVYLGARPSGTWSLTLQSAAIVDGELRIVAREKASNGPSAVTYPADCAVLNREALPAGTLPVRADDTTTDEFITDGTLSVPNATNAP